MKVSQDPRLPLIPADATDYARRFNIQLTQIYREFATQLNALSEGYIGAVTNASIAAPTTGTWNQGDFVANSTPSELGTASSKYTIRGWRCISGGTPGTWVQCRELTGN